MDQENQIHLDEFSEDEIENFRLKEELELTKKISEIRLTRLTASEKTYYDLRRAYNELDEDCDAKDKQIENLTELNEGLQTQIDELISPTEKLARGYMEVDLGKEDRAGTRHFFGPANAPGTLTKEKMDEIISTMTNILRTAPGSPNAAKDESLPEPTGDQILWVQKHASILSGLVFEASIAQIRENPEKSARTMIISASRVHCDCGRDECELNRAIKAFKENTPLDL